MKLIKILTISFCIVLLLSQSVFALDEIFSTGESWETTGKFYANLTMDSSALQTRFRTIV